MGFGRCTSCVAPVFPPMGFGKARNDSSAVIRNSYSLPASVAHGSPTEFWQGFKLSRGITSLICRNNLWQA